LGHWYARRRARVQKAQKPMTKEYPPQLEDPIALVVSSLLRSGVHAHFPNTKPSSWTDDRFFVYLKDYGSTTYIVVDDDLDFQVELDLAILEDPNFNLVGWYLKQIRKDDMFYKKYMEHHQKKYQNAPEYPASEEGVLVLPQIAPPDGSRNQKDTNISKEVSVMRKITNVLDRCAPYLGDDSPENPIDPTYRAQCGDPRFVLDLFAPLDEPLVCIYDRLQGCESYLSWDLACWSQFSSWKETVLSKEIENPANNTPVDSKDLKDFDDEGNSKGQEIPVNGIQVDRNKYVSVQRNAARIKDSGERLLPKPVVIKLEINELPVRALIDSGSLGDFISSTIVNQLKLKRVILEKPIGLQLAVQGSRTPLLM
jgi:hypothetical protein